MATRITPIHRTGVPVPHTTTRTPEDQLNDHDDRGDAGTEPAAPNATTYAAR